MIPSPIPRNTEDVLRSNNTPEGFSISTDVVSEEAWDEIRSYLGVSTIPRQFDEQKDDDRTVPSITIDGIGAYSNAEGCGVLGVTTKTSSEIPWESTPFPQNRPVAQFGFRYDYEKDVVVPPPKDGYNSNVGEKVVPKIPDVFQRLLLRPYQSSVKTKLKDVEFTQCIVNVYRPSTTVMVEDDSNPSESETKSTACTSSIPWHFDDPQFGPEILVFTFGETRALHMRLKHEGTDNDSIEKIGNDEDEKDFSYFTAYPAHRSCYVLTGPARHKWQHSVPSGSSWRVSITFRARQDQ